MPAKSAKERITWLHERIRGESYPNAARLSERFGISYRQAERDIDYLKKVLKAPAVFVPARHGYKYKGSFSLPDSFRIDDTEDVVAAIAVSEQGDEDGIQMRIPYMAEIELYDKLAPLELGRFITGRAKARNHYHCEFRNPDFFIGMLLASGKKVKIISPEWLRRRLTESCSRLIDDNKD